MVSIAKKRATFPVVVHLVFLRQGYADDLELLLLRRANSGFMDGYFVPPGGHVEAGELPLAAAHRESVEEVGVAPEDLQPLCVLPYVAGSGDKRYQGLNLVFSGTRWVGELRLAEPQGADAFVWCPVDQLPRRCAPWVAEVIQLQTQQDWYRELSYS